MRMIDGDRLLRELTALSHGQVWPGWTYEGIRLLIERQPTLTPPNEWVSVDERLPEEKEMCLLYTPRDGIMCVGFYDGDDNWEHKHRWKLVTAMRSSQTLTKKVTHWMPLPAPPDSQKKGEK